MADRPIIFSGPMVRALYAGHKTQTRRLATSPLAKSLPGDRLYVREAFASTFCPMMGTADPIFVYREEDNRTDYGGPWKPSIHMPRAASRLTLVVKDVRYQRLWDLTAEDAQAEGVVRVKDACYVVRGFGYDLSGLCHSAPQTAFGLLWDSLHGDRAGEAWNDNPEIIALTFDIQHINIDKLEATHG